MTFLTLKSVSKSFGRIAALNGIDLEVGRGSRTAVVGPSASGKTTLLRIIAGFETPDCGHVILDGEPLVDGPRIVPAHRRRIGYVAQDGALFPHLTIGENIGFGLDLAGAARIQRIAALMDLVELAPSLYSRRPDQLSGGQQQRVAIARALAQKPRLMLLDEPFSSLDAGLRDTTRKAVGKMLGEAGITTILITHDQAEALSFADQVAVLSEGKILQAGTPRDLYMRPDSIAVASYFGETIIFKAETNDKWANSRNATSAPAGKVTLMFRPEQIQIRPLNATQDSSPRARVIGIDFTGPNCIVRVRLENSFVVEGFMVCEKNNCLNIRCSPFSLPELGTLVELVIDGAPHAIGRPGSGVDD